MHRSEDRTLHTAVAHVGETGRPAALATVLSTRGSTPRKTGTKMLVYENGDLVGTVGGGCGEGEVIEAALEVIRTGEPRMVRVDLTEDLLSWSPAVCGGVMNVLVESVAGEKKAR